MKDLVVGRGLYPKLMIVAMLVAACGGASVTDGFDAGDDNQDRASESRDVDSNAAVEDGSGGTDSADPDAFHLGNGAWMNSCIVLDNEQVASATGYTVLEGRQSAGCDWVIEPVDESVINEFPSIGWMPMTSRQFDIQQETAPMASSDIVVEPITGLGVQAFWLGNTVNDLGEVWVQTDQMAFRIVNQFASVQYEGDTRQPMESLAAALVETLSGIDVIAASGPDAAAVLVPPDRIALPEGFTTLDGLIDELSAVPVPDGAVFGFGDVFDRASQDVYLDMSISETARFYLEALPAAGFEITSSGSVQTEDDVLQFSTMSIGFLDPDGNSGDLLIREGFFAPTQLGIQIFGVG